MHYCINCGVELVPRVIEGREVEACPNDDFVLRFRGAIAWAKFELAKEPAKTPQYRAGVEFTDGDPQALDSLISRHRA